MSSVIAYERGTALFVHRNSLSDDRCHTPTIASTRRHVSAPTDLGRSPPNLLFPRHTCSFRV